MNDINPEALGELLEDQIKSQRVAVVQAKDGHVFVFTTEHLETLLARAIEGGGKVCLFVKHQPQA